MIGKYSGHLLKGASILSKGLFLLIVVPFLDEGVFGEYFTLLTSGLILSRILSFGCSEKLPLITSGDRSIAAKFMTVVLFFMSISFLSLYLGYEFSSYFLILSIAANFAFSSYFSGLIRVYSHSSYELVVNMPWLIQILLSSLAVGIGYQVNAIQLILFLMLGHFFSVCVSILANDIKVRCTLKDFIYSLNLYFSHGKSAFGIVLSNLAQIIHIRSFVLLGAIFMPASELDKLAITFSMAEVIWQFSMVQVNHYLSAGSKDRKVMLTYGPRLLIFPLFIYLVSFLAFLMLKEYDLFEGVLRGVNTEDLFYAMLITFSVLIWTYYKYFLWMTDRSQLVLISEIGLVSLLLLSISWKSLLIYSLFAISISVLVFLKEYIYLNQERRGLM